MLLSGAALAKDLSILCAPNLGGAYLNKFSGNGVVSFLADEYSELLPSNGRMTLSIETSDSSKTLMHEFEGTVETIKEGFMSKDSYFIDMTSKDKKIALKMFLNGPKGQSTSRVVFENNEFRSSCDSIE